MARAVAGSGPVSSKVVKQCATAVSWQCFWRMAGTGASPAPARAKLLMKAAASSRFRMADESFLDQENSKRKPHQTSKKYVNKWLATGSRQRDT